MFSAWWLSHALIDSVIFCFFFGNSKLTQNKLSWTIWYECVRYELPKIAKNQNIVVNPTLRFIKLLLYMVHMIWSKYYNNFSTRQWCNLDVIMNIDSYDKNKSTDWKPSVKGPRWFHRYSCSLIRNIQLYLPSIKIKSLALTCDQNIGADRAIEPTDDVSQRTILSKDRSHSAI